MALYNPAILKDEDFLAGFVARNDLVNDILVSLQGITPRSLAKHRLILGQRGMGKTTLLRRIALGIRDDSNLSNVLLPLTFREEHSTTSTTSTPSGAIASTLSATILNVPANTIKRKPLIKTPHRLPGPEKTKKAWMKARKLWLFLKHGVNGKVSVCFCCLTI